jgi:hypothetical protein
MTQSFLLLAFLLLFLQVYLVDLDHRFLVFLVVVGRDRTRRTDHLNDVSEFVHLRPVGSVEALPVAQVDIRSVGQ